VLYFYNSVVVVIQQTILSICSIVMVYLKWRDVMNYEAEATYHYVLSDMVDLIRQYGYSKVINDLDAMIATQVNKMTNNLNPDGVPVIFEERN